MQYGRGTLTHSESPLSSLWSDDDISEFLPFDQTVQLRPQFVDEEEGKRYLSELLRQDMIAAELGWCNPETIDNYHYNMEGTRHEIQEHGCPNPTWIKENFKDDVLLSGNGLFRRGEARNLYLEDLPVQTNHIPCRTPRNPNSRSNNSWVQSHENIRRQEKIIPNAKSEKKRSDTQISKKAEKRKKCITTEEDGQRVFLGGLPIGITERTVRQNLAALGYKVLKRPKILHGFAPEVWMKTADQAKDLVEKGTINIEGCEVEVRPYNSLTKLSELKKLPNVGKRSVFIGGMSSETTTKNLQDALTEMGMKVLNYPVIKHGFARQVILDTTSQAKTLIKMKKINVNGMFVDVRPFINQKHRRTK